MKVLDFGLAKSRHKTYSETQTAITIHNVIQGTPAFIAPEQALGSDDVDARADIYSTGCVAYWLLTGQLVFTAETAMKMCSRMRIPSGAAVPENEFRFRRTWRQWCCLVWPRIVNIGRSRREISSSNSTR